jgi:hypothetical protein
MPERPDDDRWSFGGAAAIWTAEGLLSPGMVVAGPDHAVMHARLVGDGALGRMPGFDDLVVTDDRDTPYALRCTMASGSGTDERRAWLRLDVEPVPPHGCRWLELRNADGATTRLLAAARPTARITTSAPRPPTPPDTVETHTDGPRRQLDIGVELPPIDDTTVCLDSLDSERESWCVHLRAAPGWWAYSEDRRAKWAAVAVQAQDDLGGAYVSNFGGSTGLEGHEELVVDFLPRLDPRARTVTLTFSGTDTRVAVHVPLVSDRVG